MIQYKGNINNIQSPSGPPLAGSAPITNLPQAGIDSVSVSTVNQAMKVNADFIAWDQAILNGQPAFTPGSTGSGYTAVVHTGSGPSNGCSPASPATSTVAQPTYLPYNYLISITTGGAVGTAKFSISYDGGANTAVTNATSSSAYVDGYGTTLVFSGTLVSTDQYQFRPVDVPIIKTTTNQGKYTLDHLGYPLGSNLMLLSENWVGPFTGVLSSSGIITNFSKWSYAASGTNANVQSTQSFNPMYVPSLALSSGSAVNSYADAYTSTQVCFVNTNNLIAVVESNILFNMPTTKTWEFYFGFIANPALGPLTTDYCAMFSITCFGGVPTIGAFTQSGTSNTGYSSTITYTAGNLYRLRVELHGLSSIYGKCARFFVNGSLMAVSTANLPLNVAQLLYVGAKLFSGDTNASTTAYLTTVNCLVDTLIPSVGL